MKLFVTYYPPLTDLYSVTVDYSERDRNKIAYLSRHMGDIMVHSGNWWSMKNPAERTPENILKAVGEIYNSYSGVRGEYKVNRELMLKMRRYTYIPEGSGDGTPSSIIRVKKGSFVGFMSCNEQPLSDGSGSGTPYWLLPPSKMEVYIERSLRNADFMLDNKDIPAPLYCTVQVVTPDQARRAFAAAFESGHRYFAMGVSEFLRYPKYRKKGISLLFALVAAIRKVIPRRYPLHLSGVSSPFLLPFLAALGVDSADGSTPVQSALAYGKVFLLSGKSLSASSLKVFYGAKVDPFENTVILKRSSMPKKLQNEFMAQFLEGGCKCDICASSELASAVRKFNEGTDKLGAAECRIIHNLFVFDEIIRRINFGLTHNPDEFLENLVSTVGSPYLRSVKKIFDGVINGSEEEL